MNEFKFSCGNCGQHLKAEADCVNLVIPCPACGATIRIPAPGTGDELPIGFVTKPSAGPSPAGRPGAGAGPGTGPGISKPQ